jgi:hypothetical protein
VVDGCLSVAVNVVAEWFLVVVVVVVVVVAACE